MKFGPYNLDLSPRLILNEIKLEIQDPVNHFKGKNGVGKTTLINEIVKECIAKKLDFAYINQNYRQNWLWWYSLAENLELAIYGKLPNKFGPKLEDYKFIKTAEIQQELYWLKPLLNSSPKQVLFNTQPEISTIDLSGGQLQRVILLRELLRKPKILILDEAFSALDKQVLPEVLDWLKKWQAEFPFILISISHDKNILELLPGKIWEISQNSNLEMQIN
jgi:ABC-type Mn2+/Zn2+ transport system ATPase subunit